MAGVRRLRTSRGWRRRAATCDGGPRSPATSPCCVGLLLRGGADHKLQAIAITNLSRFGLPPRPDSFWFGRTICQRSLPPPLLSRRHELNAQVLMELSVSASLCILRPGQGTRHTHAHPSPSTRARTDLLSCRARAQLCHALQADERGVAGVDRASRLTTQGMDLRSSPSRALR